MKPEFIESEKFDTEKSIQKKIMMVDIKPGNPGRARDKKWKIMFWQAVRQISFLGCFVHFFQILIFPHFRTKKRSRLSVGFSIHCLLKSAQYIFIFKFANLIFFITNLFLSTG
jgi:hypothetical protein